MSLLRRRNSPPASTPPELLEERWSLDAFLQHLKFSGNQYTIAQSSDTWRDGETAPSSFAGYVEAAYRSNGVVFAVIAARLLVFAEARFAFRNYVNGRPGDLFGNPSLTILERPWPGGTTGELLARMEQDASLAGNSFWTRRGDRLIRLRPDWVTIISGSDLDGPIAEIDAEVIGYAYRHGGIADPVLFDVSEVAHYSPIPDPLARWRGMSWLTPVLTEISSDKAATTHKDKFFTNAATPNLLVKSDSELHSDQINYIKQLVEDRFRGVDQAYRTMVLGGGLDAKVIGSSFEQMDFKAVQGAGETRIAAAGGVPPVIVGLSEGLQAATYSNYSQARRRFADGTIRPMWRIAAASLENLVTLPPGDGVHLAFDDRDVAFLREDAKDRADMLGRDAATIRTLIDGGFEPDAAIAAVSAGDLRTLTGQHTGLTSVQLAPPETDQPTNPTPKEPLIA